MKRLFNILSTDWLTTIFVFASVAGLAVSYSALYLFHVVLIYVVLKNCYQVVVGRIKLPSVKQFSSYHLFFVLLFLWFSITVLWAQDLIFAVKYLFYIFCGSAIALYYIFYSKNLEKLKLLFSLTSIFIILEIALSILEVTTDFRLPISRNSFLLPYFGRQLFLTQDILLNNDNLYLFSMPTGFHWNPNNLSAVLCIVFPFFLTHSKKLVSVLGTLSILFLVVESGARISFIALIIMYLVYFVIYSNRKKIFNYILLVCFLFILSDGFYIFPTNSKKICELALISNSKFKVENIKSPKSDATRLELFKKGSEMFLEKPVFGQGANSATVLLQKDKEIEAADLHFFWLDLLVNGGLVFMLVAGAWYAKLLFKNYIISIKSSNTLIKYYASSSFLSLLGFIITALGPSSSIYLLPMYILMGFSIATINNYLHKENNC